jgi:REP element-mobilizing transposase RayT
VLLYHYVCPAKYRRVVFNEEVDESLKEVCPEISKRYEIKFLEIGTDKDHVHFLVQSGAVLGPSRIIQIIKRITGRGIFKRHPEAKRQLKNTWALAQYSTGTDISLFSNYVMRDLIVTCANFAIQTVI